MKPIKLILPAIVIAQFCCTSLWFAGNAVMEDLITIFALSGNALAHLTSAVQFGFISGTLVFAILTIADRFAPTKVFLSCALLAAVFNLGMVWSGHGLISLLSLRFATGFFLAGIYPVGMKIAADHFDKGLGKSLGYLVGALVLGTAIPHLFKDMAHDWPWEWVMYITSSLAVFGGMLITAVPKGPFQKPSSGLQLTAFFKVFRHVDFRKAAFGYFGHMWELYAFWAFVPIMLQTYSELHPEVALSIPLTSFAIIGIGSLSCILGGYVSQNFGTKRIAFMALLLSCVCCLISPLIFGIGNPVGFIGFLLFWGMVVIADSPLFSTMVAHNAPSETKGTALTIVNCIGFAITIVSIQILSWLWDSFHSNSIYIVLALGPILGLIALLGKGRIQGN